MSREVFHDGDRCGERFDRDLAAEFEEGTACPDCFARLAEIAEAS